MRFGDYEFDLQTGELSHNGSTTIIPEQPRQILELLLSQSGNMVSRDEIQQKLWPDTFVDVEHSLNAAMKRLRKIIKDDPDHPQFIETIPKRGYRFVVPVQVLTFLPTSTNQVSLKADVASRVSESAPHVTGGVKEADRSIRGISILHRFRPWLAILGSCLIFAASWVVWNFKPVRRTPNLGTGLPVQWIRIRSIVVLPFTNLSGDPSQEYLADGITDALITDLAKIDSFRVISRTSAMHYKGSQKLLPEIARELGNVDAVVEGSVVRSGKRVSVTAQLVLANSDQHIWADRFEGDFGEIVTLHSNLASVIIKQIAIQPISQAPTHRNFKPMDPRAEESYLRGRYQLGQETPDGNHLALQYFQQAIEAEPDNRLAFVGLAAAHSQSAMFGAQPNKVFPLVMAAASKALQLDNTLAEAHSLMALAKVYKDRDWQGAELEFKIALQLSPGSGSVHSQYAQAYLMPLGHSREALAEDKKALEFDPLSPLVNSQLGWHFFFARQYDQAIEQFNKTLELDPDFTSARWGLMESYEQMNRYSEAVRAFQRTEASIVENPEFIKRIGRAYAAAGVMGYWRMRLEATLAHQQHGISSIGMTASVYSQLGQKNRAFQLLRKADLELDPRLILLNIDPKLDSLRDDPRFDELRERLRLPTH
jgi:TolB-like protein/DNA-binding winged helix-turn-helix (wHTH) protein/Tfp pilus assembly protein PilF